MIRTYEDLEVYRRSYAQVLRIYAAAKGLPKEELFALTSQMKRAAFSIPLNIAEGYGKRQSAAEFRRFLQMAMGSSDELHVILSIARDLGYVSQEESGVLIAECEEIGKMLHGLLKSWRQYPT